MAKNSKTNKNNVSNWLYFNPVEREYNPQQQCHTHH